MRRGGRGRESGAGGAKINGTPTVSPPEPQGISDYSGFKVPLSSLKKDWQGLYAVDPDRRNCQDFVRGVKDNMALPYAKPETPDVYVAGPIEWENDAVMTAQDGVALITQGVDPGDTL